MSFLELKNIQKSYYLGKDEFKVLKGIDVAFNKGEMISILGESGGGKSTLMNIIGGLDSKYSGDVLLNGKSLKHETDKQLDEYRRNTIGFIFQSFNLISHLTLLDNVMVPLEMTTLSKSDQRKRAEELLNKVGLKEHMHKHPNQLSGGQKQRVSIARALAGDPEMLIADEPTGALDPQNTEEILQILEDIAKEGKLVLTVTHSDKVAAYGTRIVHMTDGKIDQDKNLRDKFPEQQDETLESKSLSFGSTLKMTWDNLKYNLKRNLLIIFGGMIGIFSVIFMLGLGNGVRGYINHEIYSQVNPNSVQIEHKNSNDHSSFKESDINRIKNVKDISSAEKGYDSSGIQFKYGKKNAQSQMLTTSASTINSSNIKKGTTPKDNEVLINKTTAQSLNKNDYKSLVGKKVQTTFTAQKDGRPFPVTKNFKIAGIYDSQSPLVVTTYNTVKQALADNKIKMTTTFIDAKIKGGVGNVTPVQNKINAMKVNNKKAYSVSGAGSIVSTLNTYINLAIYVLAAIAGISLLVSAIMIIVVLYISVAERTKEIGILRALGATKSSIRMLFVSQAVLLGIFSSVISVIVGYLLQFGINSAVDGAIGYSIIQITPGNAIFGIVISIIINLLASILPANKGAKLDPIESLSAE
ncbi:ATP-binding cassette domain-containing protein [Apilactobacillus micheneri]|uniref:ATP-binding cassette domain-containing protein n=1 Tax=Apilactobacillus micheneri TaxID=1899430 RepID=A0ABY2Z3L0_9LACO|nr:ABC transporter ATP-binding protein/permease [Apilactobacillus micheneri]TPR26277.1 ATP-binding cassette domain-containing protein [Apilactobacillus micheneri]TPR27031.1 ATP-binding cassette domain-containing protein [Apilactobacillus micheneri]TPR27889.1 ATP-binding cassette domain-containing protein [Apilactobacillus micheneri]TPR31794.1 ATP-binding cassette domain-containing protein [Apilactobacillus micheneri]TPR32198.1 ATP-binding cassette domain-containing protein [Apilactobacillus mi